MKYFYAMTERAGKTVCVKFKSKRERAAAIEQNDMIALSAAAAMKMFGYTDDASRRVIRAEQW